MGHGNGCNIIFGLGFFTLLSLSQRAFNLSMIYLFFHQAGVQFGRSTKTVVGFCVLALGLGLFPLLCCPPTMRSMRRERGHFCSVLVSGGNSMEGGKGFRFRFIGRTKSGKGVPDGHSSDSLTA